MATITMQRDLVVALKRETILNVGILSKLQPMSPELSRHDINENWLEKPTQNLFNHLSHYLVCIIDPQATKSLSWPLYDTKTERAYRNEFSSFITNYSNKGLLSPVMSSYLVNPGCFKVTMLLFQMSQLAVKKVLTLKMKKDSQRKLYSDMTEKCKLQERDSFFEEIEKETEIMLSKFSNYLVKRRALEEIAAVFRKKISEMEAVLDSTNAQAYIDNLVDTFVDKNSLDSETKTEMLKIKDVYKSAPFFDKWVSHLDKKINEMESNWSEKMSPFLQICQETQFDTESLIARHTGAADRSTYMIEYSHKTDQINTEDLESQVTSQQKYVLKNLVKDERLVFPNLIRSFLIAICFILKNCEVGDEIYKFNEYLNEGRRNYSEVVKALKELTERVINAEALLQPTANYNKSVSIKDTDLPPPPDLSNLRAAKDLQCQVLFDSFTPLTMSKHQFNLGTKMKNSFAKPQYKLLATPFYQKPKEDFMKSLISCRISNYDQLNSTHNFHNMSAIPQYRPNETIAECSTGFNKEHLKLLLSKKKSSSSKKFKYKTGRPDIVVKKGGLFNESNVSSESNGLYRSHSSPNLYENREKLRKASRRKLSVMKESSQSPLEVSGIVALEDLSQGTPVESFKKFTDVDSVPVIAITPDTDERFHKVITNFNVDLSQEMSANFKLDLGKEISMKETKEQDNKAETPKSNVQLVQKTNSLEKIINRFKKVRANVVPKESDNSSEFRTIIEEKENINVNVDVFTTKRVLLPDLLSPSCSAVSEKSIDYLEQICIDVDKKVRHKPRESLGTALGVDQTFLDQFNLID